MSFDDVRVAYMPFPDMVTALGGGAIDAAASIIEPQATTTLRRGFAELLVAAPRPGTQTTVIFYGTRFVADRPELAVERVAFRVEDLDEAIAAADRRRACAERDHGRRSRNASVRLHVDRDVDLPRRPRHPVRRTRSRR